MRIWLGIDPGAIWSLNGTEQCRMTEGGKRADERETTKVQPCAYHSGGCAKAGAVCDSGAPWW